MNKITVQDLHDKLIGAHTAFYTAMPEGQLEPMIIAITGDGQQHHIVVPMGSEADKAAAAQALRMTFKEFDVQIYAFCAEAWMAPYEKGTKPDVMPSQREDKREVVITVVVDKDGNKLCSTVEINRDWETGGAVLSEPDNKGTDFGGRFAELFDDC